jgi:hypothetical protein
MAEHGSIIVKPRNVNTGRDTSTMEPFSNLIARERFIGYNEIGTLGTGGLGLREKSVGEGSTADRFRNNEIPPMEAKGFG